MRPDQFDITYKNFPMEGNMHGLIGYLKNWMQENNFTTYTLQSLSDKMVRGYFLRDGQSSNSLIAQMLPFTNSMPAGPATRAAHLPAGRLLGLPDPLHRARLSNPRRSAPAPAEGS